MLRHLSSTTLAELIGLASARAVLLAPETGRPFDASDGSLWWQSTGRIRARIAALELSAQRELLALSWLGRDRDPSQWASLLARAEGTPELGTYIAAKAALHAYLVEGRRLATAGNVVRLAVAG